MIPLPGKKFFATCCTITAGLVGYGWLDWHRTQRRWAERARITAAMDGQR